MQPGEKGYGALPNEEECSKEAVKSHISGSPSGSLFTFGQLFHFFSHPCSASPPTPRLMYEQLFCQDGFRRRGQWEVWWHLLRDGTPLFLTPEGLLCMCSWELSLTSANLFSLYSSRAQLLPLTVLGGSAENKASILLHLTNSSCSAQGPHLSYPGRVGLGWVRCCWKREHLPCHEEFGFDPQRW